MSLKVVLVEKRVMIYLEKEMKDKGYEGVYQEKKREPLFVKGRYAIEGCATFWLRSRFNKVESHVCDFDKIAFTDNFKNIKDRINQKNQKNQHYK